MPIISPTAISPHRIGGAKNWSSYWTPQYEAVYNAMTTKPGNQDMYYQSRLVKRLVDASIWAKFIRFFNRAIHTNDNDEALLDWIDPSRSSTAVNNPTFTAYQGFKGNGTNMYIKSGFTPKTDGGLLFTQDNAMYGCYSRTSGAAGGTVYEMGNRDVTLFDDVNEYMGVSVSADGSTIGINGSGVVGCNKVRNLGLGLYAVGRRSAAAVECWENGENREVATGSNSVGLCSHEFFELAVAYKTTPLYYSSRELSLSFYGAALTLEEMQILVAAFEEYMVSVGKGVIPEKRMVVIGDSISTNTTDKWLFKIPYNSYVQQSYAVAGHQIMANMDAQIVSAKAENANIYILALGRNDNDLGDMVALQAEADENIAELKAARPLANIYYMNVLPTWTDATGVTEVSKTNIRAAIAAACLAQGVTCWDTYTTPWITAADTLDGTHPNDDGNVKIWNEISSRL